MCHLCWVSDPARRYHMHQILPYLKSLSQPNVIGSEYDEVQPGFGSLSTITRRSSSTVSDTMLFAETLSDEDVDLFTDSSSKYGASLGGVTHRPTRWNYRDKHTFLSVSEDGRTLQYHGMMFNSAWCNRLFMVLTSAHGSAQLKHD